MEQFTRLVRDPYSFVDYQFQNALKANNNFVSDCDWGITNALNVYLNNRELYQLIPSLTEQKWKSLEIPINSLVRFRGQVVDERNSELYCYTYKEINTKTQESRICTGKYRDTCYPHPGFTADLSQDSCTLRNRNTVVVVPVPGENKWVQLQYNSQRPWTQETSHSATNTTVKRMIEAESYPIKRSSCPEGNDRNGDVEMMVSTEGTSSAPLPSANQRTSDGFEVPPPVPTPSILSQKSSFFKVITRLYDNYVPHVNEVVEFIGIYALCTDTYGLEEDQMSSIKSKIPEVHVLACLSQSPYYPYTIRSAINASFNYPSLYAYGSTQLIQMQQSVNIQLLRNNLVNTLTRYFYGDNLLAEYYLLFLISHYSDDPNHNSSFPINISNCNEHLFSTLTYLSEELLPSSVSISLVPTSSTEMYIPHKDYDTNCMVPGMFQIPNNIPLFLYEFEDTFTNNEGLYNQLFSLLKDHTLLYDFKYYQHSFNHYLPLCICSKQPSKLDMTLIPHLPYPTTAIYNGVIENIQSLFTINELDLMRQYLCYVKQLQFKLQDESLIQQIQMKFANRDKSVSMNGEDLHRQLTMLELYTFSLGQVEPTLESYEIIEQLERTRKSRLS